jgi:hypothetical protein
MRRLFFIAMLCALLTNAGAQEIGTPESGHARGGFGAPVLKYTSFNGQGVLMFGGRGGWIINHSLVIGGGAYGTMSEVDAPEGVLPLEGPLDVRLEYFGLEIEYIFNPLSPVHFSLSALAGGGAAHYMKDVGSFSESKDQTGETGFMWILEPGINAELIAARWLRLSAGLSYRLAAGLKWEGLKSEDFSGLTATVAFKLGTF